MVVEYTETRSVEVYIKRYQPTLRIILYDSVANSVRIKFFFYRPVNGDNPNFVSFLVFVGAAASFTAEISSFETVAK